MSFIDRFIRFARSRFADYRTARAELRRIEQQHGQLRSRLADGWFPPIEMRGPLPLPPSGEGWSYWMCVGDQSRRHGQRQDFPGPYERALARRGGKWCA